MAKNRPEVIVLCEDRAHYRLIRGFLIRRGFEKRKIRPKQAPAGCGDAKKYVREQYPTELRGLRSGYVHRALVVVVDADTLDVQERKRFLETDAQRQTDELVALIVPKWQMENWLYYLDTGIIDETKDGPGSFQYPKGTTKYEPFANKLHELCLSWNTGVPATGVPSSLREACQEWGRFKRLIK